VYQIVRAEVLELGNSRVMEDGADTRYELVDGNLVPILGFRKT